MGLFTNRKKGGLIADTIRCDENDYLIWKWHPENANEGEVRRENAIRLGSSLRVRDGAVAVFVYKQKDGTIQDYIEGPFDEILSTKNLPIISSIIGLAYNGDTPFQAEVYFINLAKVIQIHFAVPFFDIYDPRFVDFGVPTAVRGTISFRITDYKEFIKLHSLETFTLEDFQNQIKDAVIKYIKSIVTNLPAENNIPVIQIERATMQVNMAAEEMITGRLSRDFGVTVSGLDISTIEIDKTSDGYINLMSVTKDITSETLKAEKEAKIKNIHDMQQINVENVEDSLRRKREEDQYAQHKQTQSSNIAAFQIEKQAEVGIASAEALGHMGENGAARMDIGGGAGGGTSMDMAGMMTGMALGGAVGQNMAGMLNGVLGGMNQQINNVTPPPIPSAGVYNVVLNGESAGPFDIATLTQMVSAGDINGDTLVWKAGMPEWISAKDILELKNIFTTKTPPPIPQ